MAKYGPDVKRGKSVAVGRGVRMNRFIFMMIYAIGRTFRTLAAGIFQEGVI
jgi:hypothetical protein